MKSLRIILWTISFIIYLLLVFCMAYASFWGVAVKFTNITPM